MKKLINNTLVTTAMSLVILAVIATIYQARFLLISSVFETFLVNVVIHAGLFFLQKFESKYFIVEFAVQIGNVVGILVVSGFLFGWYSSTPLWIVILMGIAIYFLGFLVNVIKINDDIAFINKQIKLLKKKTIE